MTKLQSIVLALALVALAESQTLNELMQGQNQLVARLAVSTALNESSFGFLTPSKVPNFNNCFSIKKGFAAGFLLERVSTAGFVLQVCDTTTSLKCFKRVKCSSNCLVAKSCVDPTGANQCLQTSACASPCDSFAYKYEASDFGLKIIPATSNGGFREIPCGTSGCVQAVDCVPDAVTKCLQYAHCFDATGNQACRRIVPCTSCVGKYKTIASNSGVVMKDVTDGQPGYTVTKCVNGCFDLAACISSSSSMPCTVFESCKDPTGGKGCQSLVGCGYVEPPSVLCTSPFNLTRRLTGFQYVPVNGNGVTLRKCPTGACYEEIKCNATTGKQSCSRNVPCKSTNHEIASCLQQSKCASLISTTTTKLTTMTITHATTRTLTSTSRTTKTTSTTPCSGAVKAIPATAANPGFVYVPIEANGFRLLSCPQLQECYTVKDDCIPTPNSPVCYVRQSCMAAAAPCIIEIPCFSSSTSTTTKATLTTKMSTTRSTTATPMQSTSTSTPLNIPCLGSFMGVSATVGVSYNPLPPGTPGLFRRRCPENIECYAIEICSGQDDTTLCEARVDNCNAASGATCVTEQPCCTTGFKLLDASKGIGFLLTDDPAHSFSLSSCSSSSNADCLTVAPCVKDSGLPCYRNVSTCPDPQFPHLICKLPLPCDYTCEGGFEIHQASNEVLVGFVPIDLTVDPGDDAVFFYPCATAANCVRSLPCKLAMSMYPGANMVCHKKQSCSVVTNPQCLHSRGSCA